MDFGGGKVVAFNFMPACREMPKLGTPREFISYNVIVNDDLDSDHRRISFAVSYVGLYIYCMSVLTLTPGEIFSVHAEDGCSGGQEEVLSNTVFNDAHSGRIGVGTLKSLS
ncbi:hypothetical protein HYDPIDRAFT_118547 [Hydnomerulius pinastri MD-312]|uniref:Uncharacterized protein n=1 Tax=Hydnomerulius pinastri MD-312 TaxID=994086 RepID=A0A0C9W8P2_9AGAM|nr:hypothetical protein HYDPIDRAFT_118547 [Hydnomerulius pinastri MD-312]